jgi:hypothetical protein
LGQVDDGCTHKGTENAAVADGEGTTSHVLDGELVITSLTRSLLVIHSNTHPVKCSLPSFQAQRCQTQYQ